MSADEILAIARSILAQPTAPFHEDAVRGEIVQLLAQCPHVRTELDEFGNVIARYRRGCEGAARFAFAAHMDHPGYVGGEFLGGVPERYREKKPATRDFGAFAMWDLPACEVREGRIHSRACDDLIGCATIVAMLHELEHAGAEAAVDGLFSRAEEVGFVGATMLARSGQVPRETTIVSLETSSEKGGQCKMGDGVIIRVGDRTSIFDHVATAQLTALARSGGIAHQRALMAGGTCEGTSYRVFGYRTAALCVALGNYHNCGPEDRIEAEFVALADVEAMVRLCVAVGGARELPDVEGELRAKIEGYVEEHRRFFEQP